MKVLVPIHNGYEDIETSTIIDILNRAGAHIITASCNPTAPLSLIFINIFKFILQT